jgi:hypothetical protein
MTSFYSVMGERAREAGVEIGIMAKVDFTAEIAEGTEKSGIYRRCSRAHARRTELSEQMWGVPFDDCCGRPKNRFKMNPEPSTHRYSRIQ